jgi:CMP-N-acetylneuraminic acid synthetase
MLYTENRRVGPVSTIENEWSPDIDEESDLRLAESILRAREGVPA